MSQYCDCNPPTCTKCSTDPCCIRKEGVIDRCDCDKLRYAAVRKLTIDNSCCGKGYCGVAGDSAEDDYECRPPLKKTIPDTLIFVLEWYENGSDLIKKYLLIYYGVDGTCEIKDVINHRRFIHRMKVETINLESLYLENVLNIYGRKMTISEYADSCTRQFLEPRYQKAFLLIKPHAVTCIGRIMQKMEETGAFKVLRARMAMMTPEMVTKIYDHYRSEEFYAKTYEQMLSGPVVAFLLIGQCAIAKLQWLAGDVDPEVAKLKHPTSLRAIFGQVLSANAVHVSESPACVENDSSMFFTTCRLSIPYLAPGTALMRCSTCCVIKPHAVKDGLAGSIIDAITRANYNVTAFELFHLDRSHAEEFYEIYKGVLPEYSDMTEELALGPCYVLEISGGKCNEDTQSSFREFVGPRDPVIARQIYPNSLRAKFGCTVVKNAVHCTDLCQDAPLEIEYFFSILQMV